MNNKFTVETTNFDYEMDNICKEKLGNNNCESYDFYHNVTVWNFVVINGEQFQAGYSNGESYYRNDYSLPCPDLELSDGSYAGTSNLLILIDQLYESDFEEEAINDSLEEVKELCSSIDTVEKLWIVYETLRDNIPNIETYITDEHREMAYTEFC